jgi:hypothetical protein
MSRALAEPRKAQTATRKRELTPVERTVTTVVSLGWVKEQLRA